MDQSRQSAFQQIADKTGILSKILGISTEEFQRKLDKTEGEEFTLGQLRQIAGACGLNTGEIADIFLT